MIAYLLFPHNRTYDEVDSMMLVYANNSIVVVDIIRLPLLKRA